MVCAREWGAGAASQVERSPRTWQRAGVRLLQCSAGGHHGLGAARCSPSMAMRAGNGSDHLQLGRPLDFLCKFLRSGYRCVAGPTPCRTRRRVARATCATAPHCPGDHKRAWCWRVGERCIQCRQAVPRGRHRRGGRGSCSLRLGCRRRCEPLCALRLAHGPGPLAPAAERDSAAVLEPGGRDAPRRLARPRRRRSQRAPGLGRQRQRGLRRAHGGRPPRSQLRPGCLHPPGAP
mmetsp:Transcript_9805/g.30506  ORF Transcript_9805/g.30506 Transcript_9805/m.30506 type:complete len:234 (-) Transcript_9805:24-725(-)